jgi:hypothetical protein
MTNIISILNAGYPIFSCLRQYLSVIDICNLYESAGVSIYKSYLKVDISYKFKERIDNARKFFAELLQYGAVISSSNFAYYMLDKDHRSDNLIISYVETNIKKTVEQSCKDISEILERYNFHVGYTDKPTVRIKGSLHYMNRIAYTKDILDSYPPYTNAVTAVLRIFQWHDNENHLERLFNSFSSTVDIHSLVAVQNKLTFAKPKIYYYLAPGPFIGIVNSSHDILEEEHNTISTIFTSAFESLELST